MKIFSIVLCTVLFGLTLYVVQKGTTHHGTDANAQNAVTVAADENNDKHDTEGTPKKKKCPCCSEKLSPAQVQAKRRQQDREKWARQIIANYGYEEGLKRITEKSSGLAKQMQRILEKEKRGEQTSTIETSETQ